MNILDALANEVSSMLAEYFDEEDFSDLWEDDQGEDDEEEEEELTEEEEERRELEAFAGYTVDKEWTFEPEPQDQQDDPDSQNNMPPLWNKYKNKKLKKSKRLRYRIIDFGEEQKKIMSKVDDVSDFTILINNGNPKFQSFYKENSPFLLALHISELLIREISMYKNPLAKPSDLDESISDFYENKYSQIKSKSQ
jgi:hypothetical protein